jgi:VWFA-related protein
MRSGFLAVREYLDSGLPPEVEVGLFALSHGHLTRLTAFSRDIPAHLEALARLEENHAARDTWVMEEEFREDEVRDAIIKGRQLVDPGAPTRAQRSQEGVRGRGAELLNLQPAEMAVHGNATEQSIRVGQVLDSLQSLAAAMSRLPGRKSVVFVGDGVREQAGLNYAIGAFDLQRFSVNMREPFRMTGRTFKRSGVAFSPVSLVGVYNPGPVGPRRPAEDLGRMDYRDPQALDELIGSMEYLAKITGGRRPIAINDFTGEVARAVSQPLRSYVLGFVPLPVRSPGTAHQISVRVSRPGMVISARTEYIEQRPGLDPVELMDGAAVLPDEFRDLVLTAELRTLPAPKGMVEVHVQSRFSPSLLAWTRAREGRRAASIQFNGLLRRRSGQVLEIFRSAYALNFDPGQPPRTLVFQAAETVPAGDLEDVVLVATDMTSGKVGTAVVPVPAAAEAQGERTIPVSAPVYLAPATRTHLLTSTREPVLGVRLGGRLYLPTEPPLSGPGPVLVMARVVDLPEAGKVRFCVGAGTDRCLQARLQPVPEPVTGTKPQRAWSAWISLAEDIFPEVDGLRVEVLDDTAPAAPDEEGEAAPS